MPFLPFLFLRRKSCFVSLKGFLVFKGNVITFRSVIGSFNTIQITWDKFLSEEVRNHCILRFCVIMNAKSTCHNEAGMFIEVNVALHADYTDAHLFQ